MKYKASRDIPEFAKELRTLSPSKIAERILSKRNEERTPESVTMWFSDHPEVFDELSKELVQGIPTEKQAVEQSMFQKGNFQEIKSIKDWILYMRTRRHKGKPLHPEYVKRQLLIVRWVCRKFEKHPDRLNFRDAQEIFLAMENQGKDTCQYRRALKDFLKSKGVPEWEKIGVGKARGFGKYRTLFVEKSTILQMLDLVKTQDEKLYAADMVMWRNGLRINAVLKSKIEDFKPNGDFFNLTVLEKFREIKTFMLIKEVGNLIQNVIGQRKEGLIFEGLTEARCGTVNREALKRFVPELEPKIHNPNHFFRHMFFQHLLRATEWNKAMCAEIGQCTVQSLDESYGGAPEGEVQKWCMKYLPMLGVEVKEFNPEPLKAIL